MRVAILAAIVALAACAPSANTTTNTAPATPSAAETSVSDSLLAPPTPADVTIHIRADKDGQTVHVPVNQRFAVELVGVPTAGYQWAPAQMPAFVTRAGEELTGPTIAAQNQPGYTGGNHWEVYTFAATGAGSGNLVMEQRRPWEHSGAPAASFRVTVIAQ